MGRNDKINNKNAKKKHRITSKKKKENMIVIRNERVEREITEELYKVKRAKENGEKYRMKIKTKGTQKIELEHTEYANDTQLINRCKEEEDKLEIYKKHAENYDLEIQWKKTVILRKGNKIKEEKNAKLREPFGKVKEERQDKILGLNIAINGAKEAMVQKRIEKG